MTFGTRLAMALNSVVTGIVIARWLGASELGVYLVLATAIQLAVLVGGFGLHMTSNYFTAGRPERLIPVGLNIVLLVLVVSLVAAGAVWLLSPAILAGVPAELVVLAIISIPFQAMTGALLGLFFSQGEIKYFNSLDLISQVLIFLASVTVLVIFGKGLFELVLTNTVIYVSFSAVVCGLFYRYASRTAPHQRWRADLKILGEMIRFSSKGFLLWMSTFFLYRLDLFVVNAYRGRTEAAVYAVATQCTLLLLLLPHVTAYLLQTKASAEQDQAAILTAKTARYTARLLGAFCLAAIPAAYIVVFAYGKEFGDLPLYLWLLLPGIWFAGTQYVLLQYFVAKGLPVSISFAWLVTVGVNVVLNLALVPAFGAVGAAFASSVCYIAISAGIMILFKKKTGIGFRQLFWTGPDPPGLTVSKK